MVGQERLLQLFDNYSLVQLPKSFLLLGESGCGKHTLINRLANRFDFKIIEIDSKVTEEDIIEYQQTLTPKFYVIDLNTFTEAAQNKILKFIEEPAKNVYVILLAESEVGLLTTILNRCPKYKFEVYTVEQLKQVKNGYDDFVYSICTTPGQVLNLDLKNLTKAKNLCELVVNKINSASYSNTMSLMTKINYKEEYDKIDFDLFFKTLLYLAYQNYVETNSELSLKLYLFTAKFVQNLVIKTIAKETFMMSYLDALWEVIH